jgi:hypothetical protein
LLDLSSSVLEGLKSLSESVGQTRFLPQPELLPMAQNGLVVVGIDAAENKVDAGIRSLSQSQTFPSTAEGQRKLIVWPRRHKVGKGSDGGQWRL